MASVEHMDSPPSNPHESPPKTFDDVLSDALAEVARDFYEWSERPLVVSFVACVKIIDPDGAVSIFTYPHDESDWIDVFGLLETGKIELEAQYREDIGESR